jgi:uncharacterized membrane protein
MTRTRWLILLSLSALLAALSIALWASTGDRWVRSMVKNIVLAWLPLLFALGFRRFVSPPNSRRLFALLCAGAWLIYYPNAPYLCTEYLHLHGTQDAAYWLTMVLIDGCALLGLALAYLSLEEFRRPLARRFGEIAGWTFVALIAFLSGCGIYFGRVLRLNSWTFLTRPALMDVKLTQWYDGLHQDAFAIWFALAFAGLIFASHLLFFTLAQPGTAAGE